MRGQVGAALATLAVAAATGCGGSSSPAKVDAGRDGAAGGTLTCNKAYYTVGSFNKDMPLAAGDFACAASNQAYQDLLQCACSGACAAACDSGLTHGDPDFCQGMIASNPCHDCVQGQGCGQQWGSCLVNNSCSAVAGGER